VTREGPRRASGKNPPQKPPPPSLAGCQNSTSNGHGTSRCQHGWASSHNPPSTNCTSCRRASVPVLPSPHPARWQP
jgi:hypothetical protein